VDRRADAGLEPLLLVALLSDFGGQLARDHQHSVSATRMTEYVLEQQRRRTNRVRALLLAVTGPPRGLVRYRFTVTVSRWVVPRRSRV
jgi:hypothetical protein